MKTFTFVLGNVLVSFLFFEDDKEQFPTKSLANERVASYSDDRQLTTQSLASVTSTIRASSYEGWNRVWMMRFIQLTSGSIRLRPRNSEEKKNNRNIGKANYEYDKKKRIKVISITKITGDRDDKQNNLNR